MHRVSKTWATLSPLLMLASLLASPLHASQVEARQGDPKEERPKDFTSPMVLELPLPNLSGLEDGEREQLGNGLNEYYCDDVAIDELRIKRNRRRPKAGGARIYFDVRGRLYVRPSHDREVRLTLELAHGDEILAETVIENIEAEEKKYKRFKSSLDPRESGLNAAFDSEPEPILRITMWVRDD